MKRQERDITFSVCWSLEIVSPCRSPDTGSPILELTEFVCLTCLSSINGMSSGREWARTTI